MTHINIVIQTIEHLEECVNSNSFITSNCEKIELDTNTLQYFTEMLKNLKSKDTHTIKHKDSHRAINTKKEKHFENYISSKE